MKGSYLLRDYVLTFASVLASSGSSTGWNKRPKPRFEYKYITAPKHTTTAAPAAAMAITVLVLKVSSPRLEDAGGGNKFVVPETFLTVPKQGSGK